MLTTLTNANASNKRLVVGGNVTAVAWGIVETI